MQATGLAGKQAYVTLSAVDQGVLNITDYPVPDAWAWMFAKRALGVDAYDLYSRIIEAMDGAEARLRYGGDMSGKALPHAARLNPQGADRRPVHRPGGVRRAGQRHAAGRGARLQRQPAPGRAGLERGPLRQRRRRGHRARTAGGGAEHAAGDGGRRQGAHQPGSEEPLRQGRRGQGQREGRWPDHDCRCQSQRAVEGRRRHHAEHAGDRRRRRRRGQAGHPRRAQRLPGRPPLRVRRASGLAGAGQHRADGAGRRQAGASGCGGDEGPAAGHRAHASSPSAHCRRCRTTRRCAACCATSTAASSRPPARATPR